MLNVSPPPPKEYRPQAERFLLSLPAPRCIFFVSFLCVSIGHATNRPSRQSEVTLVTSHVKHCTTHLIYPAKMSIPIITPQQVSFQGKQRLMGEGAASVARSNFKNTVREVKRLVGRVWGSPDLEADLQRVPFKCM